MSVPRRSELMETAEAVCFAEGVKVPDLRFRNTSVAQCMEKYIELPSPEWVAKHHGIEDCVLTEPEMHEVRVCYRLTLLHELAHWIEQARTGDTRHSPFMYATFFRLAHEGGFDLEFAREMELRYKPRAAKQGWALYQTWVQYEDQIEAQVA